MDHEFLDHRQLYSLLMDAHYPFSSYPAINQLILENTDDEKEEVTCPPIAFATKLLSTEPGQYLPDYFFPILDKILRDAYYQLGEKEAVYQLAILYYYPRYKHVNLEKSFKYAQLAAKEGLFHGNSLLGYFYLHGIGCSLDYNKAFLQLSKGAYVRDPLALYSLADMYKYGYCFPVDLPVAYALYNNAKEAMTENEDFSYASEISYRLVDLCINYAFEAEADPFDLLNLIQEAEYYYYRKRFFKRPVEEGLLENVLEARKKLTAFIENLF